MKLFYSESDSSNLLRFNLPVSYPASHSRNENGEREREGEWRRREREKKKREIVAYTLYDCGASHKFVNPSLLQKLAGGKPKTRHRGDMQLTTAGRVETLPLKEVHLELDIGGLMYSGWFVVYPLAKYDIILGKDWMEEIPHHVNHRKNRLCLGGDGDGSRFKFTIDGLRKDEGRATELMTTKAEPTRPQGYNAMELLAIEFGAELVDEVVIGEIVDEATFKADCAIIWAE